MALGWIDGFKQVMFNHILREGNMEVDHLSNLGVDSPDRKVINKILE